MPDDVLKHFASAAATYDEHAKIQRVIALDLLRRCLVFSPAPNQGEGQGEVSSPTRILDAGCGTGLLTNVLSRTYPDAQITAVDFSEAMLKVASSQTAANVRFLHADLRDIEETGFDLIASNAAMQWLPDIDETIHRLHARLATGGVLAISYFGPDTYSELRSALTTAIGHPVTLPSDTFASPPQLMSIALGQCLVAVALKGRVMNEAVLLAAVRGDEPEAPAFVKPFDGADATADDAFHTPLPQAGPWP